ncbi:hypothetical protein C7S18_00975 [Ahniella affigens]|uniref:Uncharacterized protein n=1 Tax=Ahniella affigens TaxID=2021234 RepID=A0A2P1PLY6_9GAMM|nr:hypothetical protein [Ahniella affigens]AVP95855.1 hypothetical protein C7S18_00975 [Ahniella affigens]
MNLSLRSGRAATLVLLLVVSHLLPAADLVMGTYRIPLSNTDPDVQIDPQNATVSVAAAASAGVIGDGWCPPDVLGSIPAPAPYVEIRKNSGGIHRISIDPTKTRLLANGDVDVTPLTVGGRQGDGWCPATVTFTSTLTISNSIAAANVTPRTLAWATVGAASCNTTGTVFPAGVTTVSGWPLSGSVPTSSTGISVTVPDGGAYTFRINCLSATGGVFTRQVSLNAVLLSACTDTHAPPAGRSRMTSFNNVTGPWNTGNREFNLNQVLDTTRWDPALPGQLTSAGVNRSVIGYFGRTLGDTALVPVGASQYIAMKIVTTGMPAAFGAMSSEQPGQNAAPLLLSFSHCPGDFAPTDSRCVSDYGIAAMGWTFGSTPNTYCPLIEGVDYYLNMAFLNPTDNSSDCTVGTCWWLLTQSCQGNCRAVP